MLDKYSGEIKNATWILSFVVDKSQYSMPEKGLKKRKKKKEVQEKTDS